MTKIRLKRMGSKKRPYYRIVVMDSAAPRDGRAIEELGYYHPIESENQFKIKQDRVDEWIMRGAVPTDIVKKLLSKNKV